MARHQTRVLVVGSTRLVPTNEEGGVPDVASRLRGHRSIGVVDPGQERVAAEHGRGGIEAEVQIVPNHRPTVGGVVVVVTRRHVRLDQREVGQGARRGILLELGKGNEVGGQSVLQAGEVDDAGERQRHGLTDVDLPGLPIGFEPLEQGLGRVLGHPLGRRAVHDQARGRGAGPARSPS